LEINFVKKYNQTAVKKIDRFSGTTEIAFWTCMTAKKAKNEKVVM
jgi:hypothetical protein